MVPTGTASRHQRRPPPGKTRNCPTPVFRPWAAWPSAASPGLTSVIGPRTIRVCRDGQRPSSRHGRGRRAADRLHEGWRTTSGEPSADWPAARTQVVVRECLDWRHRGGSDVEDHPAYPARLEGSLDPQLSRWLWLVKWLLAIRHYVVLFFLWIAFVVLTIVAFFAILFTGRYPRGIFEFTLACCAGPGASRTSRTARWARTATRRSPLTRHPTTRRRSTSPTQTSPR
jgi:hypothetical protein